MRGNPAHIFAASWAMELYRQNAVYTLIPKNGCSSLRLTLAIENGCIDGPEQANWIHQNNETVRADLRSLATAAYTFVVLRCPFRRLSSAYLDKVVGREIGMWQLDANTDYKYPTEQLTFRRFVELLHQPDALQADAHWRPQSDFLVYQDYDDWFQLEEMQHATTTIENKLALTVQDARGITRHGTDQYRMLADRCYADVAPTEIFAMQQNGESPSHRALYDRGLVNLVSKIYANDINLYMAKFGGEKLLFKLSKIHASEVPTLS